MITGSICVRRDVTLGGSVIIRMKRDDGGEL